MEAAKSGDDSEDHQVDLTLFVVDNLNWLRETSSSARLSGVLASCQC